MGYRWPDLSPVIRQYVVKDEQDRYGIAYTDPVYHPGVLFAHPVNVPYRIDGKEASLVTDTPWRLQSDGYQGTWYDYTGPSFPSRVPDDQLRHLTIIDDLGYLMPDRWIDKFLADQAPDQPKRAEMNVKQAEDFAREAGDPVTARAIRHAADVGFIPGARKVGRDWLIPYEGFNSYLDNRPKRGPK